MSFTQESAPVSEASLVLRRYRVMTISDLRTSENKEPYRSVFVTSLNRDKKVSVIVTGELEQKFAALKAEIENSKKPGPLMNFVGTPWNGKMGLGLDAQEVTIPSVQ